MPLRGRFSKPSRSSLRYLFALLAAIPIAACSSDSARPTAIADVPTASVDVPSAPAVKEQSPESDVQAFAKALAVSLANPGVRTTLRDAWRDSHISTDHKLVSNEYFLSPDGSSVMNEMAKKTGTSTDELSAIIRRLPPLDVYLPIRSHRTTWRATDDVLVAATFDQNVSEVQAYDTKGTAHTVLGAAAAKGAPLIVIHPAEPKYAPQGGERYSAGDLIELTDAYPAIDTADVRRDSEASYFHTASFMTTSFRISYFDAFADDGPFGGDLEMEFRAQGFVGTVPISMCSIAVGTANLAPNPPLWVDVYVVPNISSMPSGCPGVFGLDRGYMLINKEMDSGGINSEDDFGWRKTGYGSLPHGLNIDGTERSHLFYNGAGTTSNRKMLYMNLWIH